MITRRILTMRSKLGRGTGRDKYIDNERMCREREREALGEDAYLRKVMPLKAYRTRQEWAERTAARLDGLGRAGTRQALNHGKLKAKPYDL